MTDMLYEYRNRVIDINPGNTFPGGYTAKSKQSGLPSFSEFTSWYDKFAC